VDARRVQVSIVHWADARFSLRRYENEVGVRRTLAAFWNVQVSVR
jgi:hypothetical protein